MPKFLLYLCLFFSGATSLTYEILWTKQLSLFFGGTLYAMSAVLCAFMTGLALGALVFSHLLQKYKLSAKSLVIWYALLEAGIGLYGLGFPVLLEQLAPVYHDVIEFSKGSELGLHFFEFSLGTALMLPSTFLMGATLPVFGSWAVAGKPDAIHSKLSYLYSLNTLGGVFGCLISQWVAIPKLGVSLATNLTVSLNGLIFILCLSLSKYLGDDESKSTQTEIPPTPVHSALFGNFLLILFGFSGFVALSSEILWTRILIFPLGSSLYSFSLILACFLFGIALGSFFSYRVLGKKNLVFKFLCLEFALGCFLLIVLPALSLVPEITTWADNLLYQIDNTPAKTLFYRSVITFGLMFLPTFGFGMLFPLANQIHFSYFLSIPKALGTSYAINTIGAILATVLTPFVLIPFFGIRFSLFLLYASLSLISAAGFFVLLSNKKRLKLLPLFASLFLIAFIYKGSTLFPNSKTIGEENFSRLLPGESDQTMKLLAYKEGPFSTLSVKEDKNSLQRSLFIDGFSTASVSESLSGTSYMQAMGWVPMMLHPDPKDALVMCFGTGNTLGTVSLFPGVTVDGVEIDSHVLSFASWFKSWNQDVLHRPNVKINIQDARHFIRWTQKKYDVITLEPMHPAHRGVAHLYSKEFYQHAKRHLNEKGIVMQWLPLHLLNKDDSLSIVKTFTESFPHTSVWNSFLTRIVLLVGSNEPVKINHALFEKRMQENLVRKTGQEMGIHRLIDFMDFYLTDGSHLTALLANSPIITDDKPILENSTVSLLPPLKSETDEVFLNLLKFRLTRPFEGWTLTPYLKSALRERTAQRFAIFSRRYRGPGHEAFKNKKLEEGLSSIDIFLGNKPDTWVTLSDEGWKLKKP